MALQGSGSISFSQIANEFGLPSGRNLGAYRISQSVGTLSNLPLDSGISQSGSISFSNFYSKRLNIVVDFHSGGTESRQIARARYNNNDVTVIGGFKSRPSSGSGSRVITNVNKTIGSAQGNINNVALRTGSWESDTNLEMQIGPAGQLFGAGGNGGGASGGGEYGTSALGIDYQPIIVTNRGYIQAGGGGGGGSNSVFSARRRKKIFRRRRRSDFTFPGNGGGGGGGFPQGSGGNPGGGSAPNFTTGGGGGSNGSGQNGGAGGSNGNSGSTSGSGIGGGSQGRAIIVFNNGTGVVIANAGGGSISGPTVNNTNPT